MFVGLDLACSDVAEPPTNKEKSVFGSGNPDLRYSRVALGWFHQARQVSISARIAALGCAFGRVLRLTRFGVAHHDISVSMKLQLASDFFQSLCRPLKELS
ncbi:MAG: hypothetical protein AAGA38_12450 [Pseudomonadota bacterium]